MPIPTRHYVIKKNADGTEEKITLGDLSRQTGIPYNRMIKNIQVTGEDAQTTAEKYVQKELERMNENRTYTIPEGLPEADHKAILEDFAKKLGIEVPDTPEDGSTKATEDAAKTYANKTYSFPDVE